jgi:hypothetical protein
MMHSTYPYPSPAQEFEGWADYRARLREELDTLGAWVSELPAVACVILTLLEYADKRIDLEAGIRSARLHEFEANQG